ncbi:MAG: hypothetical protein GC164_14575 [Phycisphaera sp.]|nr:hypothetical protein [Phycisphaera sp.]
MRFRKEPLKISASRPRLADVMDHTTHTPPNGSHSMNEHAAAQITRHRTTLGADCTIAGELNLDNDALVLGQFDGTLRVTGMLELGSSARIKGSVVAGMLRVAGRVEADVVARDGLELLPGAAVIGQVFTPRLTVADGAMVDGHVCVGPKAESLSDQLLRKSKPKQAPKRENTPMPRHNENATVELIDPEATEPINISTIPESISAILQRQHPPRPLRSAPATRGDSYHFTRPDPDNTPRPAA